MASLELKFFSNQYIRSGVQCLPGDVIGVVMDKKTKRTLEEIFTAGLKAVDPEAAVRRHVQLTGDHLKVDEHLYPLAAFERIIVTGFGKGTAPMARALDEILGDRLTEGWITVKYSHGLPLKKIRVMEAGHPIRISPDCMPRVSCWSA